MLTINNKLKPLPTNLQLIDLDFDYIRKANSTYVKQELIAVKDILAQQTSFSVGISLEQKIVVSAYQDFNYNRLFGLKHDFNYQKLTEGKSIAEAADQLIAEYIDWLKRNYHAQAIPSYIDDLELHSIFAHHQELFTSQSFADYLVANLDLIDGELISIFIAHYLNDAEFKPIYHNFIKAILAQLNTISTIKSSALNALVIEVDEARTENRDCLEILIMADKLYKIIINTDGNQPVINFDKSIEYKTLLEILPKEQLKHLKLPLSAIPILLVEKNPGISLLSFTRDAVPLGTSFILTGTNDLEGFIDTLLEFNKYNLNEFYRYMSTGIRTELSASDYDIIERVINNITANFANVTKLQVIANMLKRF